MTCLICAHQLSLVQSLAILVLVHIFTHKGLLKYEVLRVG